MIACTGVDIGSQEADQRHRGYWSEHQGQVQHKAQEKAGWRASRGCRRGNRGERRRSKRACNHVFGIGFRLQRCFVLHWFSNNVGDCLKGWLSSLSPHGVPLKHLSLQLSENSLPPAETEVVIGQCQTVRSSTCPHDWRKIDGSDASWPCPVTGTFRRTYDSVPFWSHRRQAGLRRKASRARRHRRRKKQKR